MGAWRGHPPALKDFWVFLVALEGWDEIRAGEFTARPGEHLPRQLETMVARSGARRFQRLENRLGNHDSWNFIAQPQCLLVAIQRPDSDEHRNRRLAAELLQEGVPVLRIKERLGHGEMRASFDFRVKTLDFVVEIVSDGIHGDADSEVRSAAESFPCPVGALIQAMENLDQADGIDFLDAAGFRVVADGGRVAGDGKNIADAADGPRAEKRSLKADDVLIARG